MQGGLAKAPWGKDGEAKGGGRWREEWGECMRVASCRLSLSGKRRFCINHS